MGVLLGRGKGWGGWALVRKDWGRDGAKEGREELVGQGVGEEWVRGRGH